MSEQQGPGAGVGAVAEVDEADAAGVPADPGLAAERDRLARTLRETRLQLAMTQARLAALEQSATRVTTAQPTPASHSSLTAMSGWQYACSEGIFFALKMAHRAAS